MPDSGLIPAPQAAPQPASAPAPVIERLPSYLQAVEQLAAAGRSTVSSEELASRVAVGSAILRRDLSHLDFTGRRGVGYDIAALGDALRTFLGLQRPRRIAIAGAGRLGSAIADYAGVRFDSFRLTAVFDTAPEVVGTTVGGVPVQPITALGDHTAAERIDMLIIAVPAAAAQSVADAAVAAGIAGILNFAPSRVRVPAGVHVRHVDIATELQVLAHYSAIPDTAPDTAPDPAEPADVTASASATASATANPHRPREHAL